jgi:hypothetical protein
MSGDVGGNLADLESQSSTFVQTQGSTEETASIANRLAGEMEAGLDEISETMRQTFAQTAEEYNQIARDTQAKLDGTQWVGGRRERAVAAGAELETSINQVNASQEGRVEAFRAAVVNMAADMVADMEASYGGALNQAREAFQTMESDVTAMRQGLEQIDAGGIG